jgi:hypothetical protein
MKRAVFLHRATLVDHDNRSRRNETTRAQHSSAVSNDHGV